MSSKISRLGRTKAYAPTAQQPMNVRMSFKRAATPEEREAIVKKLEANGTSVPPEKREAVGQLLLNVTLAIELIKLSEEFTSDMTGARNAKVEKALGLAEALSRLLTDPDVTSVLREEAKWSHSGPHTALERLIEPAEPTEEATESVDELKAAFDRELEKNRELQAISRAFKELEAQGDIAGLERLKEQFLALEAKVDRRRRPTAYDEMAAFSVQRAHDEVIWLINMLARSPRAKAAGRVDSPVKQWREEIKVMLADAHQLVYGRPASEAKTFIDLVTFVHNQVGVACHRERARTFALRRN